MSQLTRRGMLAGVAAGLTATAGCVSLLTGDEPLEFSANPVSVTDDALESTGYELVQKESPTLSEEFSVAGQTREVEVTNHAANYAKTVDVGPLDEFEAAMFAVFVTPQIEVATRTFNPIGEMSDRQLLNTIAARYDGLSVDGQTGSREVETLDKTVTVQKYEATTTVEDQEVPIYLLLSRFKHGEDYLVTVGGYPRRLDDEEENVYTLIRNVQH